MPALTAFLAAACGSSTSTNVTSPSSSGRCQTTVTGNPLSFGASGRCRSDYDQRRTGVRVDRRVSGPWILLTSSAEGQGDGSLSYRVVENGDPVARRARIAVGGQELSVAEEPAVCRFDISPASPNLTAAGGQFTITVRAHAACAWTVATSADGVQVSPAQGKEMATFGSSSVPTREPHGQSKSSSQARESRWSNQLLPGPIPAPAGSWPAPAPDPHRFRSCPSPARPVPNVRSLRPLRLRRLSPSARPCADSETGSQA